MQNITDYLGKSKDFYNIKIFDCLESTNTYLKESAQKGADEGEVIIAKEQTGGRGKMNRTFFSPKNSGLYMSILLKPDMKVSDAVFITAAAAVAVSLAIESISCEKAEIKWVNDIYCKGRKVCGILTESALDLYSGKTAYTVVGIGVNLKTAQSGFPSDISHIAGAVFDEENYSEDKKLKLTAQILENFYRFYLNLNKKEFVKIYKERSNLLGKKIDVLVGESIKKATAIDIDNDCRLIVRYENGETQSLISGDVSIKL